MNCAFCNTDTEDYHKEGNLIIYAHNYCAIEEMRITKQKSLTECLMYPWGKKKSPKRA